MPVHKGQGELVMNVGCGFEYVRAMKPSRLYSERQQV